MFSDEDIHYGAGAFDQAMRSQTEVPGILSKESPGVAVGILSAAMRSGLPAKRFDQMLDTHFSENAVRFRRILDMYEGNDWDLNLWHLLPNGKYKLCTDLCRPGLSRWRYDPSARDMDE